MPENILVCIRSTGRSTATLPMFPRNKERSAGVAGNDKSRLRCMSYYPPLSGPAGRLPVRLGRIRVLIDGARASAVGRSPAAGEVVEERAVELPRVEFLDRGLRVGQRAARDAQEVDRAVQAMTTRRAAHVEVGVVGQRSVRPEAGAGGVLLAVEVDREGSRLAVGLGDDVVPLAVVDEPCGSPGSPGAAADFASRVTPPVSLTRRAKPTSSIFWISVRVRAAPALS